MTRRTRRGAAAAAFAATVAAAMPVWITKVPAGAAPAQAQLDILRLVEQTPAVAPEGTFTAQVSAVGAPPGAKLRVVLHGRVPTRSQFARTIEGESLGRVLSTPVNEPLDDLPHIGRDTVVASFDVRESGTDTSRVRITVAGVYPVEFRLLDAADTQIDQLVTHLLRLPSEGEDAPPLAVSMILPLHASPALRPDGSTVLSDSGRAGLLKASAELLRQPSVPLDALATPETIDALAEATAAGDEDLLASLRQGLTGRGILPSPYVPVELGSWTTGALTRELEAQIGRGDNVLAEQIGPPRDDEWVADATVTDEAVSFLRNEGVTRVVVPESALEPLDARLFTRTLARRFTVGPADAPVDAVMADTALSAHAGASDDPVLDAQHLLADLATIYFDEPGLPRGAVVQIPASWTPDAAFLRAVLTGLGSGGIFRPTTLDGFFDSVPASDDRGAEAEPGDPVLNRGLMPAPVTGLGSYPAELTAARALLDTYRTAIGPDSPRGDPFDRSLLVSGSIDLASGDRSAYLEGVRTGVLTELGKVEAPADQTITLTARTGKIPIIVRNTAGYPLQVLLQLDSDRLVFPELTGGETPLTLVEETTRVEVAVRARASGDSPLDVTIATPDGRLVLATATYRVRSTAVSGVGVMLSVGAGLFLAAWWIRTILRDRRRRSATAAGKERGEIPVQ
jgi:hypothetical protein